MRGKKEAAKRFAQCALALIGVALLWGASARAQDIGFNCCPVGAFVPGELTVIFSAGTSPDRVEEIAAEGVAQIAIVVLGNVSMAARAEPNDPEVCVWGDREQSLACREVLLYQPSYEFGRRDSLGLRLSPPGRGRSGGRTGSAPAGLAGQTSPFLTTASERSSPSFRDGQYPLPFPFTCLCVP
jgi:hypothetical protein